MAKAKKKRRKGVRFGALLFFVLTPLVVWFFAFLIWFHWEGITRLISEDGPKSKAPSKAARNAERSDEKILEEDRKRLDEILKKRQ